MSAEHTFSEAQRAGVYRAIHERLADGELCRALEGPCPR